MVLAHGIMHSMRVVMHKKDTRLIMALHNSMHLLHVAVQVWFVCELVSTCITRILNLLVKSSFVNFQIVVAGQFFSTFLAHEVLSRMLSLSVFHHCLSRLVFNSANVTFMGVYLLESWIGILAKLLFEDFFQKRKMQYIIYHTVAAAENTKENIFLSSSTIYKLKSGNICMCTNNVFNIS